MIGESLEACRAALQSEKPDPKLHLLERVNIDLKAQNSIVPSARSLARMKMSGRLPNLHINFSDSKYKTLMRLLDVTIPRLGDEKRQASPRQKEAVLPFQAPSGFFGTDQSEYVVDDTSERGSIAEVSMKSDEVMHKLRI